MNLICKSITMNEFEENSIGNTRNLKRQMPKLCHNCKTDSVSNMEKSKYWHLPLFAREKISTQKKHVKMPEISLKRL